MTIGCVSVSYSHGFGTRLGERMAREEATMPHLATKADLYRVALAQAGFTAIVVSVAVGVLLRFG